MLWELVKSLSVLLRCWVMGQRGPSCSGGLLWIVIIVCLVVLYLFNTLVLYMQGSFWRSACGGKAYSSRVCGVCRARGSAPPWIRRASQCHPLLLHRAGQTVHLHCHRAVCCYTPAGVFLWMCVQVCYNIKVTRLPFHCFIVICEVNLHEAVTWEFISYTKSIV